MWLFRHKYLADETLSRYKTRLVAHGSTQLSNVYIDPVVKLSTIRMVLSLAISWHGPVHQLDVKNDFLHGDLSEIVYMHQPSEFQDSTHFDYVCLLQHSLYGLNERILERAHIFLIRRYIGALRVLFSILPLHIFIYFVLFSSYYLHPLHLRLLIRMHRLLVTMFFGNNLLFWSSKRQPTLSCSNEEEEYRGVANSVVETCFSSKSYVKKFLRALHPKWSSKVTAIKESKDLTSLSLDKLIRNMKVYEVIINKDFEMVKGKREQNRSLDLKAIRESSDEDSLTSDSKDKEYAMAVRDFKFFLKDEEDLNYNQRAFVGGSWGDSDVDEEEKTKDEKFLMAKASNEVINMPRATVGDTSRTKSYIPRVSEIPGFFLVIAQFYKPIENRCIHEGRVVDQLYFKSNGIERMFTNVHFNCLFEINEPIIPRFILDFYSQVKFQTDEHGYLLISSMIQHESITLSRTIRLNS
nr:ribonuclease H-like domain-containing protein [Tanacetum cinerariifolium]